MKKKYLWGIILLSFIWITGCNSEQYQTTKPTLDFLVSFQGFQNGETEILLQVLSNDGNIPADENFDGQYILYSADGTVLSKAHIKGSPALIEGEPEEIIRIQTRLDTEEYVVVWGVPDYGAKVVKMEMVDIGPSSIIEPRLIQSISLQALPEGFPDVGALR
ncbi:MAG: hypothetical protein CL609_05885 [Anaerolineaceae bacterium]|nr:hypothetical protein [Anaerolineaceae bacterium]